MSGMSKLLNRIDLQRELIDQINHVVKGVNLSHGRNLKLVFATNFALIQGELTNETIEEDDAVSAVERTVFQTIMSKALDFRHDAVSEEEQKNINVRAVNDESFVMLRNVIIKPYTANSTHTIEEMILFTDHIVGVTLAEQFD